MARFPDQLTTERLVLRLWEVDDAPIVRAALDASDAHLRPWIPFMRREPRTLEQTRAWLQGRRDWFTADEHWHWGVFGTDGQLHGEVMLLGRLGAEALEIGYWLHVDSGGRGYAREAVLRLVDLAFAAGADRLEIHCDETNLRSNVLPRAIGFELDRAEPGGSLDGQHALNVWVRYSTAR